MITSGTLDIEYAMMEGVGLGFSPSYYRTKSVVLVARCRCKGCDPAEESQGGHREGSSSEETHDGRAKSFILEALPVPEGPYGTLSGFLAQGD